MRFEWKHRPGCDTVTPVELKHVRNRAMHILQMDRKLSYDTASGHVYGVLGRT